VAAVKDANVFTFDDLTQTTMSPGDNTSGWSVNDLYTFVPEALYSLGALTLSEVDLMAVAAQLTALAAQVTAVQAQTGFFENWLKRGFVRTVDEAGIVTYTLRNATNDAAYCHWTLNPATGARSPIVFD
jgi:hypothetical protein